MAVPKVQHFTYFARLVMASTQGSAAMPPRLQPTTANLQHRFARLVGV